MIDKNLIIKYAILNGWEPVSNKTISIHRSKNLYGTDLGEWWLQQSETKSVRRVTDVELKSYLRDSKLNKLKIK